ncbi:19538_t:CDS:2, partial [Gigaspora rosea]
NEITVDKQFVENFVALLWEFDEHYQKLQDQGSYYKKEVLQYSNLELLVKNIKMFWDLGASILRLRSRTAVHNVI